MLLLLLVLGAAAVATLVFRAPLQRPFVSVVQRIKGMRTVEDRVAQYGELVQARVAPLFEAAGVSYPPRRMTLVGLKSERMLQVWVAGPQGNMRLLRSYPILGMSGVLGPKLREGDRQVPEGLYRVESLNPNSLYHLALRVNYPNDTDRENGRRDGRTDLGSDIMIHGKDCSIGCLAMGDEAAEDLFVLAALVGIENVSLLLCPVDFRTRELPPDMPPVPEWTVPLYAALRQELGKLGLSPVQLHENPQDVPEE